MSARTRVVKIGEDGYITLHMPDMAGRYLVVEESDGRIVLSPYDLRWERPGSSIAKFGGELHFIPGGAEAPPSA